jgi:hypothetical protein
MSELTPDVPPTEAPPPAPEGDELDPRQVPGYEPKFPRLSTTRRVLGHVTDEVDQSALGPRNTLTALAYALWRDDNTPEIGGELSDATVATKEHLDQLVGAGLVEDRGDGSYGVTDAGWVELHN